MRNGTWIFSIAIIVLSIAVFIGWGDVEAAEKQAPAKGPKLAEGEKAISFGLKPLIEKSKFEDYMYLEDFLGSNTEQGPRLLLLGFFASYCKACKGEFDEFIHFDKRYHKAGLRVVMINIDRDKKGLRKARRFVAKRKPRFPVLWDRLEFVVRRYFHDEFALPTTFLIDREGKVIGVFSEGDRETLKNLEKEIRQRLFKSKHPDSRERTGGKKP